MVSDGLAAIGPRSDRDRQILAVVERQLGRPRFSKGLPTSSASNRRTDLP
jgi:hypothetical protein